MHLYTYLDKLGERPLYRDTDCYICPEDECTALDQCDDALGDKTFELKANEYISDFVSADLRTMHINNVII